MPKADCKRLGIIAGSGKLPVILAEKAKAQGCEVVSIVFSKESADALTPFSSSVYLLSPGQVGKVLKTLKKEKVFDVTFAGKVEKSLLYKRPRLDFRAIKILASLKNRTDDTVMLGLIKEIQKEGMDVINQTYYLKDLLPSKGIVTGRALGKEQKKDIEFGFSIAKHIAGLDIGQTVVVKKQAVMAIEAIEGTDEAIKRGCSLCERDGVVVKVAKPKQDQRFDLPVMGVNTVLNAGEYGARVIAIEAGKTLLVEKEAIIATANRFRITIVAV